jgi:amidase
MTLADDTRWLDATAQAELVRSGQVTPAELVEAAIERIEALDGPLNAVVLRWFDHARAAAADPSLPAGAFRGVPFLLKDLNAPLAGQPMTNGNRALKDTGHRPTVSSTLVERFTAAGLVTLGRTNSPEFGSLPVTEPECWGATRNPWDTTRSPGGSSGGAAAAVAMGMVPVAHASDGGGSIRIPASACGLVGLKPSQGRITLGPLRSESNVSVEHVVSRTVRDCAALLDATHGPGVGDTVIAQAPARPYLQEVGADPGRLRVGLLAAHPRGGILHAECAAAVRATAALLEGLGHHVEEASPPALSDETLGTHFGGQWAANMAVAVRAVEQAIGRATEPHEVEPVNRAFAELAAHVSAADLAEGQAAIARYRRAIHQWWADGWDLLLTPTLADLPPAIGELANDPDHPLKPSALAVALVPFTPAFNTSGQPAISLPLHRSGTGLPVGVQLVAAYGREDLLIRVAAQLEQAAPWVHLRPPG